MAESQLQQLEKGTAPLGLRMAIAEGLIPLSGDELVRALNVLTHDPSQKVRQALRTTIGEMPRGFLVSTAALNSTSPDLLFMIAQVMIEDEQVIQPIILNRYVDDRTLVFVAEHGPVPILEILAQNRNRMLEKPLILKKLLENEQLSRVTRFSLEEFRERFHVSFDEDETAESEAESGSEAGLPAAETSVMQDLSSVIEPVAPEDLETRRLDGEDVDIETDELPSPPIDAELLESLEAEGLQSDEYAARIEEMESVSSELDLEIEEYEDEVALDEEIGVTDGLDDGWNIDALVKQVGGVGTESGSADGFGFDELVEFSLDEADDSLGSREWMGDEISELARQHGIKIEDDHEEEEKAELITDTRIRMMRMSAADKLLLAKMGTKQERAILVTDPNKKVAVAVVEGPKMSEFEIQLIASNRQVYEEVLRAIAQHRKWGKSPSVRRELVLNPKTPLDITVRLLNSLNEFTLKDVMKSKEIPSALAIQAKRVLEIREKRRGS